MRILHVSDLHACEAHYRWLVEASSSFSLVAISGDLLDLNQFRLGTTKKIDMVVAHLRAIRVPLVVCSGNHDSLVGNELRLHQAKWLHDLKADNVYVDGDCFEIGGHKFRCVGWDAGFSAAKPDETVWLIHTPPDRSEVSIARGGVCFGDMLLGDLYRSEAGPKLALSGHVHDADWKAKIGNTWVLNPGFSTDPVKPNYNVIDLARGIATHHAASGETDIVRLWS
jgi:Icc-related predicted phosphoesterase